MARTLTQVYLEPAQKKALQRRAKQRGTKVSEEIREIIDVLLEHDISPAELRLLDEATRRAKQDIDAMATRLVQTNRRLDRLLAQMNDNGGAQVDPGLDVLARKGEPA